MGTSYYLMYCGAVGPGAALNDATCLCYLLAELSQSNHLNSEADLLL